MESQAQDKNSEAFGLSYSARSGAHLWFVNFMFAVTF